MAMATTLPAKYSPPVPTSGMLLIVLFFGLLITTLIGFFVGARWAMWAATAAALAGFAVGLAGGIADRDPNPFFAYEVAVFPVVLTVTFVVLRVWKLRT